MVRVTPTTSDRGMLGDLARILVDVIRATPWPFVGLTLLLIVGNARTGVYVASIGSLTQALIDQDRQRAIASALAFLGAGVVEQLYWPLRNHVRTLLIDHATLRIQRRVLAQAADVPLEAFEDGRFFARLQRANDNLGQHVANVVERAQDVAQVSIMFVAVLVPLWLIHPVIVLFLLVGCLPAFVTEYRTAHVVHDAMQREAISDRLSDRIGALLLDRNAGAELRLFGNGPMLVRRWRETRMRIADAVLEAESLKLRGSLLGEAGIAVGIALTILLVVRLLVDGRAPVGAWVTVLMGIQWSLGMIAGLAQVTRAVREESAYLSDLYGFEDLADQYAANARANAAVGVAPWEHCSGPMALAMQHTSFAFPGSDRSVVDRVTLDIAPGEHVAIVGENGAGKTTLVRLLTGLYVPTHGTVLQDGTDTRSPTANALRPQIGAVFQDYVAWQLPVRDNIGMSDPERLGDDAALRRAADEAGILDLIDALPDGLDTWLGREFGERDLSGGQWQRIALARAFFRDARFLVMDEPTSALDPLAEQRLFERFTALAAGRTALIISHRLGPARLADRIVVMDGGRIAETGHHDDLIAAGGLYARMYTSQAEWYNSERHSAVPIA